MQLAGSVTINAPREQVWKFLTDPYAVSQCAPGFESLEIIIPDKEFKGVGSVGLGSVKAKFTGTVTWVELDPPNRAKLAARGTAPGSAVEASSEMTLSDGPDGTTEMNWVADITVLGTLASLAARVMGSVTRQLTAEFFDCVRAKIEE